MVLKRALVDRHNVAFGRSAVPLIAEAVIQGGELEPFARAISSANESARGTQHEISWMGTNLGAFLTKNCPSPAFAIDEIDVVGMD